MKMKKRRRSQGEGVYEYMYIYINRAMLVGEEEGVMEGQQLPRIDAHLVYLLSSN